MTVLIDPNSLLTVSDNDVDLVLERGMRVVANRRHASASTVAADIDGVLGL
jgi:hypothetical protein